MKNKKETIRKIVGHLNNEEEDGGMWLPNIQRPFVWNEEQIERLFDSIMREYPISTLLVWKTTSSIRRREFINLYRRSVRLTDYYVPEDSSKKKLVLDGQQRLQSLFIGLKGSYDKQELYFDILSGDMAAPDDIRYRFRFMKAPEESSRWIRFKDIVFSDMKISEMRDTLLAKLPQDLEDNQKKRVEENVEIAFTTFKTNEAIAYQELDSIDRPDVYREDDVVEIFIRANSGGTRLGKSDLLFSLLSSSWEGADEGMYDLLEDLNKDGYDFTRDFVLKTCLTVLGKGAAYEVAKFRQPGVREEIEEKWSSISDAIKCIKDFLKGSTYARSDKAMPSYLNLIPLIYFRYHFKDKWNSAANLDEYVVRTLLSGSFSGSPDQLINECVRHIRETEEFSVSAVFNVIREQGRNLEISRDQLLECGYGSRNIHLIFNLWYRGFDYTPSYADNLPQIDHIFPQSLLRKEKVRNPETGRDRLKYYAADRDQLANCMLLTKEENGAGGKSDTPAEEWFADKDESYLDMHLIPRDPELWKLDRYEDFVEARKELLLQKFKPYLLQETEPQS